MTNGNVRTIGSGQDARLYYEDVEGNRKKYLLEGEAGISGSNVTSINGLSGDVTLTISDLQNDAGFITASDIPVNSVNGQTGDVTINFPVTSVNGAIGDVVVNIPVSSVNGQTGDVLLDVHDIKYETVSGLALSSYVYYTVSSTLTGTIQYSIPSGLHDTMVKFTTGTSAEFAISVDETMQLNKEFNFEGDKSYVLAVDNGMVFWNELTEELDPPEPPGEWIFEVAGALVDPDDPEFALANGRYKKSDNFDQVVLDGYGILYINENEETYIQYSSPDAGIRTYVGNIGLYEFFDANLSPAEPWNWANFSGLTITPIV